MRRRSSFLIALSLGLCVNTGWSFSSEKSILAGRSKDDEASASQQEPTPYIELYDSPGQTGDSFRIHQYIPDLSTYDFDNIASSECFYGIWLLYDYYNYNTFSYGTVHLAWGEDICLDLEGDEDNMATSLKYSGASDGYKYETFNVYNGEKFQALEEFSYFDKPQMTYDNISSSVIITGCIPWTVYEDAGYQGESLCLFPSDTVNCYPGFYPYESDLGLLANDISSVKKGCFSDNIRKPSYVPKKNTWLKVDRSDDA